MKPVDTKKSAKKYEQYEIEGWADTIIKAEEIKADPKKMALVKPMLEKKHAGMKKAISSIADLRALSHKSKEEEEPMDDAENAMEDKTEEE